MNEIFTKFSPNINLSNETKYVTIQQLEQPAEISKQTTIFELKMRCKRSIN